METKVAISFLLETKVDPALHTGIQHNYDVGLGDTVRQCGRRTNFNELHTSCPLDSFFFEVGSWDLVLHKDEFHTNPHTAARPKSTAARLVRVFFFLRWEAKKKFAGSISSPLSTTQETQLSWSFSKKMTMYAHWMNDSMWLLLQSFINAATHSA